MLIRTVIVAAAAVSLAACSSAATPHTAHAAHAARSSASSVGPAVKQSRFVQIARLAVPGHPTDAQLVTLGHNVCAAFRGGNSYRFVAGAFEQDGYLTPFQAWTVVGVSTVVFCPEFKGQIPAHSPAP